MEVLFKPADPQLSAGDAKRRGTVGDDVDDSMEGVFAGTLAVRRRWESKKEESRAFSCMLWCTIALGAMTSNLSVRTVRSGIRVPHVCVCIYCWFGS